MDNRNTKPMMNENIILDTDSYKPCQWQLFQEGTTFMSSYFESRGGKYGGTVFFGLQPMLWNLENGFTMENVEEARVFLAAHGVPFNYDGWKAMYEKHGGKFPIRIRAVAEGTVVPNKNVLMSVESTDPDFFWIVDWLETYLVQLWYPITVATQSFTIRKIIESFLENTSDDTAAEINFKLHDFGFRGASSRETAGIGGAAHLVNFMGSDTIRGVRFANHFYKCPMSAYSIAASQHSNMTSWGGREGEVKAMSNMIDKYGKPGALFACVSDSYDIYNAVEHLWGEELRDKLIQSGAKLVIRPDSGDPVEVLNKLCPLIEEKFGISYNSKGYKVFNHVALIWGDGINEESIRRILTSMTNSGYSASNIAFGMGGALLQQVNRDTNKFAFKCSYVRTNGKGIDVYKDPITDKGKQSKRGLLDLVVRNGKFETVEGQDNFGSVLKVVFENGKVVREFNFDEVRANARKH